MAEKPAQPNEITRGNDQTTPTDDTGAGDEKALLEVASLIKDFGDLRAVDVPELTLRDGEFFTLLGPSGSGKSTLLRMIAGLETPTDGQIYINGEDITSTPSNERSTALIFQDFQLFPHKTVGENIAFPLKMRDVQKNERRERTEELLEFVDLEGYYDRYPEQLSGGEQQRVSLARGLIAEPDVLLLDEPLASLDRNLREQLQVELRKFQRRVGVTFIYVTHDQQVALTMSDRVAVMNEGQVKQIGDPMHLYQHPNSEFVAKFLGEVNKISGTIESTDGTTAVLSNNGVPLAGRAGKKVAAGDRGVFCVKSEIIELGSDAPGDNNTFSGTVRDEILTGKNINYLIDPDDVRIEADELIVSEPSQNAHDISIGDSVRVSWDPSKADVFSEGA